MNRELFLRLDRVTRIRGLHRRLHQARKYAGNPVLEGEHSWEQLASLYGTVLYDEEQKLFRMWYLTGPSMDGRLQVRRREALGNITLCGYATSTDGVHWNKPILNQLEVEGSKANNLVDIGRTNCEGIAVLDDRQAADLDSRFKAIYWEHGGIDTFRPHKGRTIWGEGEGDGIWLSESADGIHWRNVDDNPVIAKGSDTTQSFLRDPESGEYVVFGRLGIGGRLVARSTSADARQFTAPQLVMAPDDLDEEGTQFYGMPIDLYEGLYVGMPWIYREGVDGTIDTALATSRDGVEWERILDRQTFLEPGAPGEWDDGMARISQGYTVVGDQIYFYYGGVTGPHTGRKFETVNRSRAPAIGLATLRRDGFVSMEAGEEEGDLLTQPITIEGDRLHINGTTAADGYLIAEVTDDQGQLLATGRSQPFEGDATDAVLPLPLQRWQGRQDLRLRFRMRRCSLYSWWMTGAHRDA